MPSSSDVSLSVEPKLAKQTAKLRHAQVFALARDKAKFDALLANLVKLKKMSGTEPDFKDLCATIRGALFMTSDEIGALLANLPDDSKQHEAYLANKLFELLKKDYQNYINLKQQTEDARPKQYQGAEHKSYLLEWAKVINGVLGNATVANFDQLSQLEAEAKGALHKAGVSDPDKFFKAREDSAMGDKKFLVVGQRGEREHAKIAQNAVKAAIAAKQVPANFGDSPTQEGAMIKVVSSSSRTGYPHPATSQTGLVRAFNIGFSQDQVLRVFRSLEEKININHDANGQENPIQKIKFKINNELYGVTAKLSDDGKRINYLKYRVSDYEAWKAQQPQGQKLDPEAFINGKNAEGRRYCTKLSGDECDLALDKDSPPFKYVEGHRSGQCKKVGEALDELSMHLAFAAGKTHIYRSKNLPEYEHAGPAAGANVNPSDQANKNNNDNSAAGASLDDSDNSNDPKKKPSPKKPNILMDLDDDDAQPDASKTNKVESGDVVVGGDEPDDGSNSEKPGFK